ncbi:MAG: hypothetical protein AAF927_28785 [Bacteroidota bacterium]
MPHKIKNDQIEITLDLPGENYTSARFDWSGKIVAVKFEGISLHGYEDTTRKKEAKLGRAFYNEFGIETAVGFEETPIGSFFHKIGVGLLKKEHENYSFAHEYPIEPCKFNILSAEDSIRFECLAEPYNGYCYQLIKTVRLSAMGFFIQYYLINNGKKTIITDEYNHNFICIAQQAIDKNYKLKFPFPLRPQKFAESLNPAGVVSFDTQELGFHAQPKDAFFFSNLSGGNSVPAYWQLENHQTKLAISERGDFKTSKVNLWGRGDVISPELFYPIHLEAGQACSWSRFYEIKRL